MVRPRGAKRHLMGFALAGPLLLAGPARAAELSLEGALGHSSGSYGLEETTRTWSLLTELSYRRGRWGLLLSLPLLYQDSGALLHSGGVRVPTSHPPEHTPGHSPGHQPGRYTPAMDDGESAGIGDPVLRADFSFPGYLPWGVATGVYAAVKPPVADAASGFSTGEWDAGAGLVAWRTTPRTSASLEIGYWRLGDAPALELENSVTYSLAVERDLPDRRLALGGLVRGASSTIAGAGSSIEVGLTLSRNLRASRAVGLTLSAGLTDAAPDLLVAVTWRVGSLAGWRVGRP